MNPRPPIIGVNCDTFEDGNNPIVGVRSPYIRSILKAGGIPLMIPQLPDEAMVLALLERVDGMLLIGGDDIRPERLGVAAPPAVNPMTPERDRADFLLLERLLDRRTPTLAICLGCQELNVARGGTIYLDLPTDGPASAVRHAVETQTRLTEHPIRIDPDGRLAALWGGAPPATVNSSHHQAIRDPGRGIRPVAWAPDGVVEAVEVDDAPFFVGVQWHPERMEHDPFQRKLFAEFVKACLK